MLRCVGSVNSSTELHLLHWTSYYQHIHLQPYLQFCVDVCVIEHTFHAGHKLDTLSIFVGGESCEETVQL